MNDDMVHVKVENATKEELKEISEDLEGFFDRKTVVTDGSIDIHEIPCFDDFADELVERMKKEMLKELKSEINNAIRPL